MRNAYKEWMNVKGWLFSPWLVIWGEEMVEGLIYSLIAFGMWRMAGE